MTKEEKQRRIDLLKEAVKRPNDYDTRGLVIILMSGVLVLLSSCAPTGIPKADCPYPCPTAINHLSADEQMAWFHKQKRKNEIEMKRKGQWTTEPNSTLTVIQETP